MWEPPWKSLVEQLEDDGDESPYLSRLRSRVAEAGLTPQSIQREMLTEMSSALKRAEDKLNAALLELELAGRAADAAAPGERAAAAAAFNEQRERAVRVKWEFMVHREALGLRWDASASDLYPVPPKR